MKKICLIINPIAGLGLGRHFMRYLARGLEENQFEPIIKATTRKGDARTIVKETPDCDYITCIGGDGTFNEIINGITLNGRDIPIGLIPMGSGNVLAKELKLSARPSKFIKLLKDQKTRTIDIGEITFGADNYSRPRFFASMVGIGFDAEVVRQHHLGRRGRDFFPHMSSYLPLSLKIAWTYKNPRMNIEVDGKLITTEASFIQVANVRSYGGPFVLAPHARPDDGWLDVMWFKAQVSRDIWRYYWDAFWFDVTKTAGVGGCRVKEVKISSRELVPVQVDGDFCGYLPVSIRVIPRAISVIANH